MQYLLPDVRETAANEQPRMDANIERKIVQLFDFVSGRMTLSFPDSILRAWAKQMIGGVNKTSKKNLSRTLKKGFEKDAPEFEQLMKDDHLNPFFDNIVDMNVGLIKSIPEMELPSFKNQLVAMITADMPASELSKVIQENFHKTKSRARFIAVDQIGKMNGVLEQHRQEQLGLKRYRWRNSGDGRVAGNPSGRYPHAEPSHWDREGKIYSWNNPPKGGHPKQRPRCRCWAEPILEDIIDS